MEKLFQPIERMITEKFIPALNGGRQFSTEERRLLSLPTRYGGLNIINPVEEASEQFCAPKRVTEPLKEMIIGQSSTYRKPDLREIKSELRREKAEDFANKADAVREKLSSAQQRQIYLLSEKGSSFWLTVMPLQEYGFNLSKSEFCDALSFRYGWQLKNLAQYCVCGAHLSADHAMIILRHNEIRDIAVDWLSEVCPEMEKEPQLQPITGEILRPLSANRKEYARPDIKAKGFWRRQQCAFF